MGFEKIILNKLLDKYEKSVLSRDGSDRNLKISLSCKDQELSSYTRPDSYNYRDSNDATLKELEQKGFIFTQWSQYGDFETLKLNIANVDAIYSYLKRENPSEETASVLKVLNEDKSVGFVLDFVEYCKDYVTKKYTYPKKYFNDSKQLKNILAGLNALLKLKKEIKIRDFSINVYGDSKYFEKLKGKVSKIIKDFDAQCKAESDDEVLAEYNIVKNSTYALIKNNFIFKLNNLTIDLNALGYEYALSDEMIDAMIPVNISANKVITVENLTSFYKLQDNNAIIVYLGGFHNHTKRMLLKIIFNMFPNGNYYHFGDIDVGGFYIFNHLKEATGIPFSPYKMSIHELKNNTQCLRSLTEYDKKQLLKMQCDEQFSIFHDVIDYMIEQNVKLEQEALDGNYI